MKLLSQFLRDFCPPDYPFLFSIPSLMEIHYKLHQMTNRKLSIPHYAGIVSQQTCT